MLMTRTRVCVPQFGKYLIQFGTCLPPGRYQWQTQFVVNKAHLVQQIFYSCRIAVGKQLFVKFLKTIMHGQRVTQVALETHAYHVTEFMREGISHNGYHTHCTQRDEGICQGIVT